MREWLVDNSALIEPITIEAENAKEVREKLAQMLINNDGYHTEIFPMDAFEADPGTEENS